MEVPADKSKAVSRSRVNAPLVVMLRRSAALSLSTVTVSPAVILMSLPAPNAVTFNNRIPFTESMSILPLAVVIVA